MNPPEPFVPPHVSVLPRETLAALRPRPGICAVDATLGAGGHASALLPLLSPGGRLIGIDADPAALEIARARLAPLADAQAVRLDLVHSNFAELRSVLTDLNAPAPHVILADLGVSSMQFDSAARGFSFRVDEPLDMRMDTTRGETAADILRSRNEEELADIFYHLGEERHSRKIARWIVELRRTEPVRTTGQLEALVHRALRVRGHQRINPATRVFQALRIAVNRELDVLDMFLRDAPGVLAENGALALISFHSLEDRRVKVAFKDLCASGRFHQAVKFERPSEAEVSDNPRSRSAILRTLYKSAPPERASRREKWRKTEVREAED
jgi:16S rRNA (cytosine1402-N4)-methyltransferase